MVGPRGERVAVRHPTLDHQCSRSGCRRQYLNTSPSEPDVATAKFSTVPGSFPPAKLVDQFAVVRQPIGHEREGSRPVRATDSTRNVQYWLEPTRRHVVLGTERHVDNLPGRIVYRDLVPQAPAVDSCSNDLATSALDRHQRAGPEVAEPKRRCEGYVKRRRIRVWRRNAQVNDNVSCGCSEL